MQRKKGGFNRRTLKFIPFYPSPKELYETLMKSPGWSYYTNREWYQKRDRAFCSLLYLLALRISEALRLTKAHFLLDEDDVEKITVRAIKLSKTIRKGKPRITQYRHEGWLPLTGPRKPFTEFVLQFLDSIPEKKRNTRLFRFSNSRGWQIVTANLDVPPHWLRAYGEDYLYGEWGNDLLAVADYISVDPRTLSQYIRSRYTKYKPA